MWSKLFAMPVIHFVIGVITAVSVLSVFKAVVANFLGFSTILRIGVGQPFYSVLIGGFRASFEAGLPILWTQFSASGNVITFLTVLFLPIIGNFLAFQLFRSLAAKEARNFNNPAAVRQNRLDLLGVTASVNLWYGWFNFLPLSALGVGTSLGTVFQLLLDFFLRDYVIASGIPLLGGQKISVVLAVAVSLVVAVLVLIKFSWVTKRINIYHRRMMMEIDP